MTVWANGSTTKPTSTSGWGWYDPYDTGELEFHYGDDEVGFDWNCAPEAGTIVYARFNGAAGNDIRVQSDRDGTIFRMLHNANLDSVSVGMHVTEGQRLAPQGNTSTQRIGRHTHFEVWPGGNINNRLDPVPWMRARIGSSTAGDRPTPFPDTQNGLDMRTILRKKTGKCYTIAPGFMQHQSDGLVTAVTTTLTGAPLIEYADDMDVMRAMYGVGLHEFTAVPAKGGPVQSLNSLDFLEDGGRLVASWLVGK